MTFYVESYKIDCKSDFIHSKSWRPFVKAELDVFSLYIEKTNMSNTNNTL